MLNEVKVWCDECDLNLTMVEERGKKPIYRLLKECKAEYRFLNPDCKHLLGAYTRGEDI